MEKEKRYNTGTLQQIKRPFLMNQLGSNGWIFFLFPIYLLFIKRSNDARIKAVSLTFICLLPMVYFTAAHFFLLWLSIIMLWRFAKSRTTGGLSITFVIAAVACLSYSIIIAVDRSASIIHVSSNIIDFLNEGFTSFSPSSISLPQDYLVSTSISNKVKYLANAALVVMPIMLLLFYRRKVSAQDSSPTELILTGLLSLAALLTLLFFWLGSLSFGRIPEYGSLLSLLALSLMLSWKKDTMRILVTLVAVLAIATSCLAYSTDENTPYRYLTKEEESAAEWIVSVSCDKDFIFTDNRLAGALISGEHLNVTGIIEDVSVDFTLSRIVAIYYEGNMDYAVGLIREEYNSTYLFFSSGMTLEAPAIFLYNYPIRPAPEDFMIAYESSTYFNKIYSNGEGTAFEIR